MFFSRTFRQYIIKITAYPLVHSGYIALCLVSDSITTALEPSRVEHPVGGQTRAPRPDYKERQRECRWLLRVAARGAGSEADHIRRSVSVTAVRQPGFTRLQEKRWWLLTSALSPLTDLDVNVDPSIQWTPISLVGHKSCFLVIFFSNYKKSIFRNLRSLRPKCLIYNEKYRPIWRFTKAGICAQFISF